MKNRYKKKMLKKAAKLAFKAAKKGVEWSMSESSGNVGSKSNKSVENKAPAEITKTIGNITLRKMRESDKKEVTEMMTDFYNSEATLTNGSAKIFKNDISECLSDSPYLEGFVFAYKDSDSSLWGYAMLAHSFSTEFGKHCVWIEDLYLREEARGMGLASGFLDYIAETYPDCLFRLEAEHENEHAMEVYKAKGFSEMPYIELVRGKK